MRTALCIGVAAAALAGSPGSSHAQSRQTLSRSGVWQTYSIPGNPAVCGVSGPAGPGTVAMEVRGDAPGSLRLAFSDPAWQAAPAAAVPLHAAFSGLKTGAGELNAAGVRAGGAIEATLRGGDVRTWMHGFTGGQAGEVGFPGLGRAAWPLDLGGTTAAVNAMQACILALNIVTAPAPFATAGSSAAPENSTGGAGGPAGYAIVQSVAVGAAGSGGHLQVLEDRRLTPALRDQMWGRSTDVGFVLGESDPLAIEFARREPLPARLRFVSATGQIVADKTADDAAPLARIEAAPLHGMATPTYFYSVDLSAGMGSYSGLVTEILQPLTQGLQPVAAVEAGGKPQPIVLAATLKAGWQVVPPRTGATAEIEEVHCNPDFSRKTGPKDEQPFVITYTTYRLVAGAWRALSTQRAGYWENEEFPDRRLFP